MLSSPNAVEETADLVGISAKTVMRKLNMAKAWLYKDLKECSADTRTTDKT